MLNRVVESLEPRKLLAGNVTVTPNMLGSDVIVGDGEANAFLIEANAEGRPQVIGIDGTTINGGSDPVPLLAPTESYRINLGDGDDELIIDVDDISFDPTFSIDAEDGDDSVLIRGDRVDSVNFDGGLGRDWLGLHDTTIAGTRGTSSGDLDANGGGGRDTLDIRNTTVSGNLVWNDRSGPGGIFIEETQVEGETVLASADDTAAFPVWVQLLDNTFTGPAALATRGGDDSILLRGNLFSDGDLDLFSGEGEDDIVRE